MSRHYIVKWPHSQKLVNQPWYYECIKYEGDGEFDSFLVPENRTIELYGKYHAHKLFVEKDELLHANSGVAPNQYRIEFDDY